MAETLSFLTLGLGTYGVDLADRRASSLSARMAAFCSVVILGAGDSGLGTWLVLSLAGMVTVEVVL